MTTPAKTTTPAGQAGAAQPVARPYPFPVGVYESTSQDYDETINVGASVAAWAKKQAPLWNVSPTGWLRALWFDFSCTIAGNAATPVLAEDGPFSFVEKITFYDLGGVTVQQYTGYEWLCLMKFGGYYEIGDPRADITYSMTTGSSGAAGSFHFVMVMPLETVSRDALGTVQNESKPGYKIELRLDQASAVYSTQPTSTATAAIRVQAWAESYTEPAAGAPNGRAFAPAPPLPGTLQYWRDESDITPSGAMKYDVSNGLGFPIRNIIPIVRADSDSTRATGDANWPDPMTLFFGNITIFNKSKNLILSKLGKDFGLNVTTPDAKSARENGVFPVYFTKDMGLKPGAELRFKYLDTQTNSLLRFEGSAGAKLDFTILTNWLAVPSRNRYALIAGS